jgi:hypothetical protein
MVAQLQMQQLRSWVSVVEVPEYYYNARLCGVKTGGRRHIISPSYRQDDEMNFFNHSLRALAGAVVPTGCPRVTGVVDHRLTRACFGASPCQSRTSDSGDRFANVVGIDPSASVSSQPSLGFIATSFTFCAQQPPGMI